MTFLLMGFCYPCFFMYLERKKKKEGKLVIFLVAKVKNLARREEDVYCLTVTEIQSIMAVMVGEA